MLDVGCEPWKAAILLCLSCVQVWALQLRAPADESENSSVFEQRDAKVGQKSTFPSWENICFSRWGGGKWRALVSKELSPLLKVDIRLLWVWLYGTMALTSCYFCLSDPSPRSLDLALIGSHPLTYQVSFGDVLWWRANNPHLLFCRLSPFPLAFLGFTQMPNKIWSPWLTSG